MLKPVLRKLLFRPEDFPPSRDDWEVIGAFNPGAIQFGDEVILLVRIAERPRERRVGYTALPRWENGSVVVDWTSDTELQLLDPRVVRRLADGLVRLTFTSHLRVVRGRDARAPGQQGAAFLPVGPLEEFGVEDPRITRIGDRYYFTYVAVSRHGAGTALASTSDFVTFERHGIIFCPENKDVLLFPERIGGEYVALHRPNAATPFTAPEMWVARSADLVHWGKHEPLWGGLSPWETGRIGGGAPPVRVEGGWLEMYHGNRRPKQMGEVGEYSAGLLLLDADNPARVLRRTHEPIMAPEEEFERLGFVSKVVFPTGVVEQGDTWLVYYGASDTFMAVAEFPRDQLLACLHP
jgi:beta-1,2-mannobiose phosphorylase / 1,2-beta-oligomannan phosphorylase